MTKGQLVRRDKGKHEADYLSSHMKYIGYYACQIPSYSQVILILYHHHKEKCGIYVVGDDIIGRAW